jgi:protein ImuB
MNAGRVACVDVPALPLQLLLVRRPEWKGAPVAVVAEDKPSALVLWVNEAARRARVLPGMRYAAGLALAAELRAGTVESDETAAAVVRVAERLRRFTPRVEPLARDPGVFLLDASGLSRSWRSPARWAVAIQGDLAAAGFRAAVAVGFAPFAVRAVARATRGLVVFRDRAAETAALRRVPLARLSIEPALRDTLAKLGVHDVAAFVDLPGDDVAARFGAEAARLHRLASGDVMETVRAEIPRDPLRRTAQIEHPETDAERLLSRVGRLLAPLLADVAREGEALAELEIELVLDDGARRREDVRPAAPTLDAAQILELVRLRLETSLRAAPLLRGVVETTLHARGVRATNEQTRLFVERPRRDVAAGERAFARLVAEHGADAVVVARLADGHLPEDAFRWEPSARIAPPRPRVVDDPPLVRRILATPVRIPPPGAESRIHGPYPVETRWWTDVPVARAHAFVETPRRRLSWVCDVLIGEAWLVMADVR